MPVMTASVGGSSPTTTAAPIHDRVARSLHGGSSIYRLDDGRARGGAPGPDPDPGAVRRLCRQLPGGHRGRPRRIDGDDHRRQPRADVASRASSTPSRRSARWRRPRTRRSACSSCCASASARIENRVARASAGRHRRRGASSASSGSIRRSRRATGCPSRSAARVAGSCSGSEGERSVETTWDAVRDVDPEQLMLMPCGFDASRTAAEFERMPRPDWFDDLRAVRRRRDLRAGWLGLLQPARAARDRRHRAAGGAVRSRGLRGRGSARGVDPGRARLPALKR